MGRKRLFIFLVLMLFGPVFCDMMRKSIVFDMKSPKVFYCPQEKPKSLEKMIVKSRPIEKLCEFEGKGMPKNHKPDCYNDIDESEYACAEKERIMTRMHPPNDTETTITELPTTQAYKRGFKKKTSW